MVPTGSHGRGRLLVVSVDSVDESPRAERIRAIGKLSVLVGG